MDNTDYIESYFTNEMVPDQIKEFERRIESDTAFAEEVTFYLSALSVSKELSQSEKKENFKRLYQTYPPENPDAVSQILSIRSHKETLNNYRLRKLVYYFAAAATIAGIIFGTYISLNSFTPHQLASQFEKENFQTLPVMMDNRINSIKTGLGLYNNGKTDSALLQFEMIIHADTSDALAKKYAGLSALRLKQYDRAMSWFKELETYSGQYSNPAVFYQALTLLDRNQSGDVAKAKELLQQVVQNNLERKETAQEWLKKIN